MPKGKKAQAAAEPELAEDGPLPPLWTAEHNDTTGMHATDPEEVPAAFAAVKPTGDFRHDFHAYGQAINILPHPQLVPFARSRTEEAVEGEARNKLAVHYITLDLGSARVLGQALEHSRTIMSLNLYQAGLSSQAVQALCDELPKCLLTKLRVDFNPLPEGDLSLVNLITAETQLEELSLRGNNLGEAAGVTIGRVLPLNTHIRVLNLFQNALGDAGAAAVADGLRFNMALSSLSLSNNHAGPEAARAFARALGPLSDPGDGADLKHQRDAVVLKITERNKAVAAHNKQFKKDAHVAQKAEVALPPAPTDDHENGATVFRGNNTLEVLNLNGNEIDGPSALRIGDVIAAARSSKQSSLRGLALRRNRLVDHEKASLATALGVGAAAADQDGEAFALEI